jgi:hypothetical protein
VAGASAHLSPFAAIVSSPTTRSSLESRYPCYSQTDLQTRATTRSATPTTIRTMPIIRPTRTGGWCLVAHMGRWPPRPSSPHTVAMSPVTVKMMPKRNIPAIPPSALVRNRNCNQCRTGTGTASKKWNIATGAAVESMYRDRTTGTTQSLPPNCPRTRPKDAKTRPPEPGFNVPFLASPSGGGIRSPGTACAAQRCFLLMQTVGVAHSATAPATPVPSPPHDPERRSGP